MRCNAMQCSANDSSAPVSAQQRSAAKEGAILRSVEDSLLYQSMTDSVGETDDGGSRVPYCTVL